MVYESPSRRWNIGLYGNNLFDEVYKTDGQEFSSIGSIRDRLLRRAADGVRPRRLPLLRTRR